MAVTYDAVYQLISETLVTKFRVPAEEIKPEATVGALELDSLALAELAVTVEEELGIEVAEDGANGTTTLAELVADIAGVAAPYRRPAVPADPQ
jgi:acyl carrier protein